LRADIAEKLLFIWLSEKGGTRELPLPDEPEAKLPLQLQQAAKTRAAQPAYAISVSFLVIGRNEATLLP
jgi:hypothetical protein